MPARTDELADLWSLAAQFPDADAATAELARTAAVLTRPRGAVHVISDVHGEDKKLRHVINNASGTLRPLIERLLGDRLAGPDLEAFVRLNFYPAEVVEQLGRTLTDARRDSFFAVVVDQLVRQGEALNVVYLVGRLIRNLAIDELIIAGDRGPRGDRVVDYLRQQPSVSFVWGNHDASWIGAALGNEALICTVLRISLRYRRLGQLDEGYSIPLTPLEHLARTANADDPAAHFMPQATGMRDVLLVARMQKAAAILQFKLEGQAIARNPQWELDHRRLLHRIDRDAGTVDIDGVAYRRGDVRVHAGVAAFR